MLVKRSLFIVSPLLCCQKCIFWPKFATCGNLRPHKLQIKLCWIHFGPISDKICGQIRLWGKNQDTKIISAWVAKKYPWPSPCTAGCVEEEQKFEQFPGKLSSCLFESFQFSDFLWISCPQLHCKCPQAPEKQRWCFAGGNVALRGA